MRAEKITSRASVSLLQALRRLCTTLATAAIRSGGVNFVLQPLCLGQPYRNTTISAGLHESRVHPKHLGAIVIFASRVARVRMNEPLFPAILRHKQSVV